MKSIPTLLLSASLLASPAWAVTLIKSEEAKLAPAGGMIATRGISRGPAIKVVSPENPMNVVSPFTLKVNFEARGGAKVDPAATKITYLKSTPVDLLPRVKPGLSDTGIVLEGAEVPPGEHVIQLSVQDSEGRVTNTTFLLNVVK